MKVVKLFVLLLAIGFISISANADTLVSKSATVDVANEHTYRIPPWGDFYIPAGTLIYNLNKSISYQGSKRDLFLTEHGLHVYFEKRKYWAKQNIEFFKKKGPTVFIKRYYEAEIAFGTEGAKITIPFTRGEVYGLVEETDFGFKISISDKDKLKGFSNELKMSVLIPRKFGRLHFFDLDLDKKSIGFFESVNLNNVVGVSKAFGVQTIDTYPKAANTSLGQYFSFLGIDGDKEINEIVSISDKASIRREYFKRKGEPGLYKITTIKSCDNSREAYFYITTPYVSDIKIDRQWIKNSEHGIYLDDTTGRALLTCPADYFALEDELRNEFHERDIPLIIYKTARWKNFKNVCTSGPNEVN